jgi:hypothetical protein
MQSKTRLKYSLRYFYVLILATAAVTGMLIYLYRSDSPLTMAGTPSATARAFAGGTFEASGVVDVAGTDAVLFVDDGKPGEIQWMRLDKDGNQSGPIKAIKLGVNIEDQEGITTDGAYFYVVNSQSRSKASDQSGIVRFKFNPDTQSVEAVETVNRLKQFLVENVSELRDMATVKAKDDGINIEGLAWDPVQKRLLLGLRSPVKDGYALLVPLKLRDAAGPFSNENLETKEIKVIRLPLGGNGIRSIEYDERSKLFNIIAGATESQDKTDFKLWEWGGQEDKSSLRESASFDRKLKPEGVTRATIGESNFKLIVFDTSMYTRID